MNLARLIRHLLMPGWQALRRIPPALRTEIAAAIAASELLHRGELRLAIEGPLSLGDLLRDQSPRARAMRLFAKLGVWDTAENSGILIYLQLVDRRVEILADRGIAAKVPQAAWDALCRDLEAAMRDARCREGVLAAIDAATELLAEHFPAAHDNPNELPNQPVLL